MLATISIPSTFAGARIVPSVIAAMTVKNTHPTAETAKAISPQNIGLIRNNSYLSVLSFLWLLQPGP